MEFKMIDALYLSVRGVAGDLDEQHLSIRDAKRSSDRLTAQLERAGINAQNMSPELEEALLILEVEHERQGFINGFRMGVQLMRECTCQVTGGEAG